MQHNISKNIVKLHVKVYAPPPLSLSRYANLFLHPVKEENAPGYYDVVLRYPLPLPSLLPPSLSLSFLFCIPHRPMDLTTIKKNIETGVRIATM